MYRFAIIEDDRPTNDKFKEYLDRIWPGCEVQQLSTFSAAIDAIKSIDFDLVVTDIDLGAGTDKLGGIKIAKVLDATSTPLLIISGSPQPEFHREIFRALDAWDYMIKPVTEEDFRIQVTRAITFRQAHLISADAQKEEIIKHVIQELVIDLHSKTMVTWKGKRVHLSMTHIRLVEAMIEKLNEPVSFEKLFELIETGRNKGNLRVHLGKIKEAFTDVDSKFDCIKNVPMMGYTWRV